MLSILKIEMIDESDGVKFIFSSFLLSSTDSNPFESTTFTVWSPQLRCLSPALRVRQQGIQRESRNCLRTVRESGGLDTGVALTFLLGFWENQVVSGLPISFTKIGNA